jgi:hypothetical protein
MTDPVNQDGNSTITIGELDPRTQFDPTDRVPFYSKALDETFSIEMQYVVSKLEEQLAPAIGTTITAQLSEQIESVVNESGGLVNRVNELYTSYDTLVTTTQGLINTESTARSTQYSSLAQTITTLSTGVNTDLGQVRTLISEETTARSTAVGALTTRVSTLETKVSTDRTAVETLISNESTSRATSEGGLAQQINTLSVKQSSDKTSLETQISNQNTALTNQIGALAQQISLLSAASSDGSISFTAAFQQESQARVDGDTANTTLITGLRSDYNALASGSGNFFTNTEFINSDFSGWTISKNDAGGIAQTYIQGTEISEAKWRPMYDLPLTIYQTNQNNNTGAYIFAEQNITTAEGEWWQAYAWMAAHRCDVDVLIIFCRQDGSWISWSGAADRVPGNADRGTSASPNLSAYRQIGVKKLQAPTGTAYVKVQFRKYGTLAGYGDSWMWFYRPYLGRVKSTTTDWNPYSPGNGRAQILKAQADITDEKTTRANAVEAVAQSVTALTTTVSTNRTEAANLVSAEAQSRSTAIDTVTGTVNTLSSSFNTIPTGSGNFLDNTEWAYTDPIGWLYNTTIANAMIYTLSRGDLWNGTLTVDPDKVWIINQTNRQGTASNYIYMQQWHSAREDEWWQAHIKVATANCNVQLAMYFKSADGVTLGNYETVANNGGLGNAGPSSYTQIGITSKKAPAGTVAVCFEIRKFDTLAGQSTSWAKLYQPYLGRGREGQTTLNPYAPGTGNALFKKSVSLVSDESYTRNQEDVALSGRITTLKSSFEASALAGGNALLNTELSGNKMTSWGWSTYDPSGLISYNVGVNTTDSQYWPGNEKVIVASQWNNNNDTSKYVWINQVYPAKPGEYWQAYAFCASHRCKVSVCLYYLDVNSVQIGTNFFQSAVEYGYDATGKLASNYKQMGVTPKLAPAGTAYVKFEVRKYGTEAGYSDSFAWFWKPYLGLSTATQTEFNPFVHGGNRGLIEAANASISDEAYTRSQEDGALSTRITDLKSSFETTALVSANALVNTDYADGSTYAGWGIGTVNEPNGTYDQGPTLSGANFYPAGERSLTIWQKNAGTNGPNGYRYAYQIVAASAGEYWQAYVWAAAHRCKVDMWLVFLDANYNVIGSNSWTLGDTTVGTGGVQFTGYSQIGFKTPKLAPAGTAYVKFEMRKKGTNSGEGDSWAWFIRPFCGRVRSTLTEWTPFSNGSAGVAIQKSFADLNSESTARSTAVGALGQRIDSTNASVLAVPTASGNYLSDTNFDLETIDGWYYGSPANLTMPFTTTKGQVAAASGATTSANYIQLSQSNRVGNGDPYLWFSQMLPAKEGEWWQAHAQFITDNCQAEVLLIFIRGSDNAWTPYGSGRTNFGTSGSGANQFVQAGITSKQAPAGTVAVYFEIRKYDTLPGSSSSMLRIYQPYLGRGREGQTTLNPYTPGNASSLVRKLSASVTTESQARVNADNALSSLISTVKSSLTNNDGTNFVSQGDFQAGVMGEWINNIDSGMGSGVQILTPSDFGQTIPPYGTRVLQLSGGPGGRRDFLDRPLYRNWAARTLRVRGALSAQFSTRPSLIGFKVTYRNGTFDWIGSSNAAAGAASYLNVDFQVTIGANAIAITPWVCLNGDWGTTGMECRLNFFEITDVTELNASVSTINEAIVSIQGGVASALARSAVVLSNNGYISGTESTNTGTVSSFKVLADVFEIASPASGPRYEYKNGLTKIIDNNNIARLTFGLRST